jgi:hypothetical protein
MKTQEAPTRERAIEALHAYACPGCGCEPEVVHYYSGKDGIPLGYRCTCSVVVILGVVQ